MATTSLAAQLITVAVLSLQRQIYHNRGLNQNSWNNSYDFVVVGGGTAGPVVAARLSENPNVNVLLLEAGGPVTITIDMMPTFYRFDPVWPYTTVPQRTSAFGLANRRIPSFRGKLLGGSHATSFAVYTRGNQYDYDRWANQYGATGWNYQNVLPYFLKSENNTDPAIVAANPQFHSTTGLLEVSTPPNPDPIIGRWLNAVQQLGWPISDYANLVNQYGAATLQATESRLNWTRQTSASAFIEVNIARPNLHVLVNSQVTRILFNTAQSGIPIATGIEFVRNNQTYQVMANREVILSAGSYNTPQLLMLSGIGPRQHLASLNIPVLADLPVGNNLYDHILILMDFTVTNASDITLGRNIYNSLNVQNLYNYFTRATGPLTRLPLTETYIATGISGNRQWPDGNVYFIVNQLAPSVDTFLPLFDESHRNEWRQYLNQFINNDRHVNVASVLFRPLSTGTIRLASTNPFDAPLIDPAFFSNSQDLAALVKTMSIAMKITESKYMAPYIEYSKIPVPGCQFCPGKPLSECYSYLACVAQTITLPDFHPASTCPMGNSTASVVDERLRVRNVQNLRVIDASIMPVITNSNTIAPTIMIAEKGSDLVKEDNRM